MSDSEEISGDEGGKLKFLLKADLNKIDDLPPEVQRRVKALKNIQLENIKQEVDYYKELHQLDLKYQRIYDENNLKRKKIYLGEYEPTDLECEWIEKDDDETDKKLGKLSLEEKKAESVKGRDEDPLDYDGPEVIKSSGCEIKWKSGKNPCVKIVKKKTKPKGKGKGGPKFVTKEEKRDTFFNFFKPPEVPDKKKDDESEDEDEDAAMNMELLNEDFDIGLGIKEKLISKAVLYFTGEADDIDIDDDYDDEDTEDEDEDDD